MLLPASWATIGWAVGTQRTNDPPRFNQEMTEKKCVLVNSLKIFFEHYSTIQITVMRPE